jgi:ribose-phosphate pyrophosphokinase
MSDDLHSLVSILALPGAAPFAARLANALRVEAGVVAYREFPDGESYVRIDSPVASRDVLIIGSLDHPNGKLLPLVFLADAARDLGARRVGLVAPYLAFMRQDTRFRPGEAITSRSFASIVSAHVDWLVTVDPHLHRFASLQDVYSIPAMALHASAELGRWIAKNVSSPFIIGPDQESRQWVDVIAATAGAPSTVLSKVRRGDTDVIESIPNLDGHRSRTPVLVDDIISTGETMIAAIRHLRDQGAPEPVCVAVHAVFAGDAEHRIRPAGASRIVTTNTILHSSNAIDIVPLVADAIQNPSGVCRLGDRGLAGTTRA